MVAVMSRYEPTGDEFTRGPDCDLCGGSRSPRPGLICVGDPATHADLALCLCRDGQTYRAQMPRIRDYLADRFHVPADHVVLVEEVVDAADLPVRPPIDIGAAGMRRRP